MKNKLTCRLKEHVITHEGDFIPEGTPVVVFGWSDHDNPATRGKIECRAAAYVYCDTWECEQVDGRDRAAAGSDLLISVDPDNLVYEGWMP
jgi:hypothetical protein